MSANEYPSVTYGGGRTSRIWWVVGLVALLVVIGVAIALRLAFAQLPPDTTLAGIDVRTPAEANEVARDIAQALVDLPVELTTAAGSATVTAGRLGATLASAELREAAAEGTGFDAWSARYTGQGPLELPLDIVVSGTDLRDVAATVSRDPVDGDVQITLTGVEVTEPVVGVEVTADAIREAVDGPLQDLADTPLAEWPRPITVTVEGEEIEPVVTQPAIDAAIEEVERLTAASVELTASITPEDSQTVENVGPPLREDVTHTVGPDDLRALLTTEIDPTAIQRQRIQVVADPTADPSPAVLAFIQDAAVVPEMRMQVENRSPTPGRTPPDGQPASGPGGPADQPHLADTSTITGDLVAEVITPGLEPDVEATLAALVRAADRGEGSVAVAGTPITDADPELLGIVQPVGTYTTFFNPGEGRNTNIRRVAEIVDGALVPPGGNYEVNHAVGRRTVEGGFVEGGAILDGEFITDVGGGVSQFATTFFNAMWFAGFDIITHTPHSFYIDRYPAGREATMDFPGVNLEMNNNTPYWVLVDTETTDDSVTVTMWSTPYFEVAQTIGEREPVPDANFRIRIQRTAVAPPLAELELGGFTDNDDFTHTYRAQ